MWPALIMVLLVGILVGYLSAKVFLLRPSPLLEEFDKLTEENERLQYQEQHLQQEVATLRQQLEEEEKARAYYQKKADNS